MRYRAGGVAQEIECDFVAGCDGFHGVSRKTIPEQGSNATSGCIRLAGWGYWPTAAGVAELIYASHERGFALCSMRSRTRSRCTSSAGWMITSRTGRTSAFRTSSAAAGSAGRRRPRRAFDRKEHRAAAQLRRRAHALRQAVPGRGCGPYRAADRRQGPEPGGQRRLLSLRRRWSSTTAKIPRPASTAIRRGHWRGCGKPSASPGG